MPIFLYGSLVFWLVYVKWYVRLYTRGMEESPQYTKDPSNEGLFDEVTITKDTVGLLVEIRMQVDSNKDAASLLHEATRYAEGGDRIASVLQEKGGGIAGYIEVTLDEDVPEEAPLELREHPNLGHIARIGVEEHYRKMGVGKRLMDLAERYAREHGKDGLWLDCLSKNTPALALYASTGYHESTEFFDRRKQKLRKIMVKFF